MVLPSFIFALFSVPLLTYLFLFALYSIKEREARAFLSSLFLFFSGVVIIFLFFFLHFSLTVQWCVTLSILLVVSLFVLPWGSMSKLEVMGKIDRYDERDIMFSRALYQKDSKEYLDYYKRNPEKQKIDDEIRNLPELLSPGGDFYDPILAKQAQVNFELDESLIPLCEGKIASKKLQLLPSDISHQLKKMAARLGAVDSGIAPVDSAIVYSFIGRRPGQYGIPIQLKHDNVFVFAVEMDYWSVKKAPYLPIVIESSRQYVLAAKIAIILAAYIRSLGFSASAHMDMNYKIILPAAATEAGLGEIGRMGYLIHPLYGGRIRLGAITTNLPLIHDEKRIFGVQDFCKVCKRCARACPAGAISFGAKKNTRGVLKWSTNQEACYRYWRKIGTDCGICMKVCPYSKPNSLVHNLLRQVIRKNPLVRKAAVFADKLLYS